MAILLVLSRLLHFADVTVLFGLAAFPFYAPLPGGGGQPPRWLVQGLGLLAVITTAMVLDIQSAVMVKDSRALIQFSVVRGVATGTVFGMVWALRFLLSLGVAYLAFRPEPWDKRLAQASGLLLLTIAFAGHSRLPAGAAGYLHIVIDALHLLAAGAWIGGLMALLLALKLRRLGRENNAAKILHRFSGMGYYAVGALVFTGILKTLILVRWPASLFSTPYGAVLIVKLVLFALMAALALFIRLKIMPALDRRPTDPTRLLRKLKRQVTWEFAVGLAVLLAVAYLGTLTPPVAA